MTDKYGRPLNVGDYVLHIDGKNRDRLIIRAIDTFSPFDDICAWCDDGDPSNPDLTTNKFRHACVAQSRELVKDSDIAPASDIDPNQLLIPFPRTAE